MEFLRIDMETLKCRWRVNCRSSRRQESLHAAVGRAGVTKTVGGGVTVAVDGGRVTVAADRGEVTYPMVEKKSLRQWPERESV